MLICFEAKANKRGFFQNGAGEAFDCHLSPSLGLPSWRLLQPFLLPVEPSCSGTKQMGRTAWQESEERKSKFCGGRGKARQVSGLEAVRPGLASCLQRGIKVIIYTFVQLDFNWICIKAWWTDDSVSRGKTHREFQTRLFMKAWTVVCSSTGNGMCLYPQTLTRKSILLGAFSKLFILTELVVHPNVSF